MRRKETDPTLQQHNHSAWAIATVAVDHRSVYKLKRVLSSVLPTNDLTKPRSRSETRRCCGRRKTTIRQEPDHLARFGLVSGRSVA